MKADVYNQKGKIAENRSHKDDLWNKVANDAHIIAIVDHVEPRKDNSKHHLHKSKQNRIFCLVRVNK